MKWHTFNCRPERHPRIWVPRKTLGQESAPRCAPSKGRLRRFLEEHQQLLLILGIIIPCCLPLVFTAKVGMSAAHRRWLLQKQEIEEPEAAPSSPAEAVIVETREDDFQQSVRHLLRTIGNTEFESPDEVATGRFLMLLDQGVLLIHGCDLQRIRLIQRDRGWARIEAIYRPLQSLMAPEGATVAEEEKYLVLELVEEDEHWKVEHLRMTARRFR